MYKRQPVDDCIDAVRFFVKNAAFFGFDTEKLFAGGSSAGGHLALMTAFAQNCFCLLYTSRCV